MEKENWTTGPSAKRIIEGGVADALTRNGVLHREHVVGRREVARYYRLASSLRTGDPGNRRYERDLTLDAYINEKKSDPAYASSFIPSTAKPRVRVTDQQALFGADVGMVARGEIEIVDDRDGPRR